MKNILVTIASKLIPGLSFLVYGKYMWFYVLWFFLYTSAFLLWFILCATSGSNLICWGYLVAIYSVVFFCGFYKSKDERYKTDKLRVRKIILAIIFAPISIITFEKMAIGIQYGVRSASMAPTLNIGENVIADPFSFGILKREIKRGDVVVHKQPNDEKTLVIHRVLAVPGDEVVIKYGQIYLNGIKKGDPFFKLDSGQFHSISEAREAFIGLCNQRLISAPECATLNTQEKVIFDSLSWKIPNNQYFLIGDNAFYSVDSKNYGFIDKEKIKSKVVCYGINREAFEINNLLKMGVPIR